MRLKPDPFNVVFFFHHLGRFTPFESTKADSIKGIR